MKKVVYFLVIIISFIIIRNLTYSIYSLLQKDNLIENARQELYNQQNKNQALKSSLKEAETKSFIEKEARDKLFLVKPDEHDVLISKSLVVKDNSLFNKKKTIPNWKAWLDLFF